MTEQRPPMNAEPIGELTWDAVVEAEVALELYDAGARLTDIEVLLPLVRLVPRPDGQLSRGLYQIIAPNRQGPDQ